MPSIALQILEGHERGRTYSELPMPITIGREEDNAIRLNDERASRVHARIQVDDDRVILTDLESTNGTEVNGHNVKMTVLQSGDRIRIGRSLLMYWAGDAEQPGTSEKGPESSAITNFSADLVETPDASAGTVDAKSVDLSEISDIMGACGAPPLPRDLTTAQLAELSDVLAFLHRRLTDVAMTSFSGEPDSPHGPHTVVPEPAWNDVMMVQRALAEYLRNASDPD